MTALVPRAPQSLRLNLASRAIDAGRPVAALTRRHVPIRPDARVVSVVGLTGDNLLLGVGLGRPGAAEPDTVLVCPEPRDPILALRFAAEVDAALRPLVAQAVALSTPGAGGPVCELPPQLWVDGPRTAAALLAWSYRLRRPWLPPALAAVEDLRPTAEELFSLLRGLLAAARIPGSDILIDAVGALCAHLAFPLAEGEETAPLPVLLACLRLGAGEAVLDRVEEAEAQPSVSASTDPDWDNGELLGALRSFKRRRTALSRGRPAGAVDRAVVTQAARDSGIEVVVREALVLRHRAVSEALSYLGRIPALAGLDARARRAGWNVHATLSRGLQPGSRWTDFPTLRGGVRQSREAQGLSADAGLEALRGDPRAFAYAEATGEACYARATGVSADGRTVRLRLERPLEPRTETGWHWLDDGHSEPVTGDLELVAPTRALWTITAQMQRLAQNPGLLTGPDRLRLTSRSASFPGRVYLGGDVARGHAAPVIARTPVPFSTPIDFSVAR
jgi:hypothetical protein